MIRSLSRRSGLACVPLTLLPTAAFAADAAAVVNWHAIVMFLVFIALTLGIT